jgi:hypothetical protein
MKLAEKLPVPKEDFSDMSDSSNSSPERPQSTMDKLKEKAKSGTPKWLKLGKK